MFRATALFACLDALLVAGTVLADTVEVVRAVRGQTVLSATDLAVTPGDVPGAITTIVEAVGKEAKVTLYPGRPILVAQLGAPALVQRAGQGGLDQGNILGRDQAFRPDRPRRDQAFGQRRGGEEQKGSEAAHHRTCVVAPSIWSAAVMTLAFSS